MPVFCVLSIVNKNNAMSSPEAAVYGEEEEVYDGEAVMRQLEKKIEKKNRKEKKSVAKTGKGRKKNFSTDETRVLREMWEKNRVYLSAAFSNNVTNAGKNRIWMKIADAINSLGHEERTVEEVRHKWKNMASSAKSTFHAYKKSVVKTGGGPAPKTPSWEVVRTIEALKDTTSFKGLEGVDTFKGPTMHGESSSSSSNTTVDVLKDMSVAVLSRQQTDTLDDTSDDDNDDDATQPQQQPESAAALLTKFATSSMQPKRRHGDTNKDVQLRVLKKEEEIQLLRISNLKLKRRKLELEIEILEQQKNGCQSTPSRPLPPSAFPPPPCSDSFCKEDTIGGANTFLEALLNVTLMSTNPDGC